MCKTRGLAYVCALKCLMVVSTDMIKVWHFCSVSKFSSVRLRLERQGDQQVTVVLNLSKSVCTQDRRAKSGWQGRNGRTASRNRYAYHLA